MDKRFRRLSLRSAALAVADLVMPRVCVVCGRKLILKEKHICTACEADLPLTHFSLIRDNPMAQSFNALIQREIDVRDECHSEQREESAPEPFSYAAALIFYSSGSPYKNIPRALKYHRNFGAGRHFAAMLGRELAASPLFADVDLVVPVPLHAARRWNRGYNQAEIIAGEVTRTMAEARKAPGPEMDARLLRRVRRTRTQTRLGKDLRYANVRTAFAAKAPAERPRHILLVDDVFTTGATLCASERALREALDSAFGPEGGIRISAATLACVGR